MFVVHTYSKVPGIIYLQNAMNTFHWLAIKDGKFIGDVRVRVRVVNRAVNLFF